MHIITHAISIHRVCLEQLVGPANLHDAACQQLHLVVPLRWLAMVMMGSRLGGGQRAAENSDGTEIPNTLNGSVVENLHIA